MVNSRRKGKDAELEFAKFLRDRGFSARRGRQYKGTPDSPDVIVDALDGFHFEVKRRERVEIADWMANAREEAPPGACAVIAHRRNDEPWVAILAMDDFLRFLKLLGPQWNK